MHPIFFASKNPNNIQYFDDKMNTIIYLKKQKRHSIWQKKIFFKNYLNSSVLQDRKIYLSSCTS